MLGVNQKERNIPRDTNFLMDWQHLFAVTFVFGGKKSKVGHSYQVHTWQKREESKLSETGRLRLVLITRRETRNVWAFVPPSLETVSLLFEFSLFSPETRRESGNLFQASKSTFVEFSFSIHFSIEGLDSEPCRISTIVHEDARACVREGMKSEGLEPLFSLPPFFDCNR